MIAISKEVDAQTQTWLSLTLHGPPSGSDGASAQGSIPEELAEEVEEEVDEEIDEEVDEVIGVEPPLPPVPVC